MKRSSGAALAAAVSTLALLAAAFLPLVECPRRSASGLVGTIRRAEHEFFGCTVCDGRGKVSPLRRLLWRPP